jgi:beta-glucosidase
MFGAIWRRLEKSRTVCKLGRMEHAVSKALVLTILLLSFVENSAAAALSAYQDPALPVETRVSDLLERLTAAEKIKLLGGTDGMYTQSIDRLGLPRFRMTDGPCGARCAGPSTAYAACVCLAATWDRDLAKAVGASMGRDCRARGINILLGPGMDLYRAPMCGRNFEYLGEDPLLSGQTAAAIVTGLQSQGVAATIKHFAMNDQEVNRRDLSSDADERTLHELQLRGFQIAVREGHPEYVMDSYNKINGIHATQNGWLNNVVLKGEFGFRGVVMTDWWDAYDTLGMANGGLDLEMPGADKYDREKLQPLIDSGKVSMETIDDKVRRQLRVDIEMGWLDRPQQDKSIPLDDPASIGVNVEEGRGGITLLKNEDNLLPLDPGRLQHLVVLGSNADHPVTGGGGSSFVSYFHAVGVPEAIAATLPQPGRLRHVIWEPNSPFPAGGETDLDVIRSADAVVICAGFDDPGPPGGSSGDHGSNNEREDGNRSYDLPPGQPELIQAVAKVNPHVIVVLNSGGSVATASWIGSAQALLHAYYPGSAGNVGLAEILLGKTNPSGKLPFSWEKRWEDSAAFGNYPDREHPRSNSYKEGVFLGYRWFDEKDNEPLFPFGFGLSYTHFALSQMTATNHKGGDVSVSVSVRNTGARPGAEVVQVYVAAPGGGLPHPPRELKAFAKVFLQAGESKTVSMQIKLADLEMWDPDNNAWKPPAGSYLLQAGDSSRNLPLKAQLEF